jgi:hypothetical protein
LADALHGFQLPVCVCVCLCVCVCVCSCVCVTNRYTCARKGEGIRESVEEDTCHMRRAKEGGQARIWCESVSVSACTSHCSPGATFYVPMFLDSIAADVLHVHIQTPCAAYTRTMPPRHPSRALAKALQTPAGQSTVSACARTWRRTGVAADAELSEQASILGPS